MDNGVVIGTREMILIDVFKSSFKGNDYVISRFVDVDTLAIFSGTDIDFEPEKGKEYVCELAYKNNKIKVVSVA